MQNWGLAADIWEIPNGNACNDILSHDLYKLAQGLQ